MGLSVLVACSSTDDSVEPPQQCRSQCELAGSCEERSFDDYPGHDDTLVEWGLPGDCAGLVFALAGTCSDGTRFVRIGNGSVNELRYFDESGAFVGLTTSTDVAEPICQGRSYWPEAIVCNDATVRTVYCGDTWAEGQSIDVPYADGVHPQGGPDEGTDTTPTAGD